MARSLNHSSEANSDLLEAYIAAHRHQDAVNDHKPPKDCQQARFLVTQAVINLAKHPDLTPKEIVDAMDGENISPMYSNTPLPFNINALNKILRPTKLKEKPRPRYYSPKEPA